MRTLEPEELYMPQTVCIMLLQLWYVICMVYSVYWIQEQGVRSCVCVCLWMDTHTQQFSIHCYYSTVSMCIYIINTKHFVLVNILLRLSSYNSDQCLDNINTWIFSGGVFGRCFWGFVLPVLVYCSAVWCSAADTHLKLLDRVVSGACFIAGGVLN